MRAARWFLDGEAERRAAGTPAAREVKGGRALDGTAPVTVTAKADRIDRTPRRLRDLRLQVRLDRRAGPRRCGATCSCRSRRRSPRPAASRGCRPGRVAHLELIGFGGARDRR